MRHCSVRPSIVKRISCVGGTVTLAAALSRRGVSGQRQMAKSKDDKTQLPTHGAAVLPSVRVDSYNIEVQDEDGFLGDKASKSAFWEILDKWRKVLNEEDEDPLGDKPTASLSKKKLTQMLSEGEPEAAA